MRRIQYLFLTALVCGPILSISQENPFLKKYAGAYHLLEEGQEQATDQSEKLVFTADGKCTSTVPFYSEDGTIGKTPIVTQGTWKASEGLIQMYFKIRKEDSEAKLTEFKWVDGAFRGDYVTLKKVVPPGYYLSQYAGTYYLLSAGQTPTPKTDKYVFTADGKCSWTFYPEGNAATKKQGTWKASEGLIQMYFEGEGGGDHGDGLMTDFRLKDGAFWSEGVYLKKIVAQAPARK